MISIPTESIVSKIATRRDVPLVFIVDRRDKLAVIRKVKNSGHGGALYSGKVQIVDPLEYPFLEVAEGTVIYIDSKLTMRDFKAG